MKKTFAYGAATSQGAWHVQEDGYYADPVQGVFLLADGFGGRGAGDLAAKLALQEARTSPGGDRSPREGGIHSPSQAAHRDLFGEINRKLLLWNEKRPPANRGGCSLVLATLEKGRELTVTSCGATAAVLVRASSWVPLLSPQAPPRVSVEDPLYPSQALGLGRELMPESRSLAWQPGDLLLLFSSGLAWEQESFQAGVNAQLALSAPGTDLGAVASLATAGEGQHPWNQTVVAVESLA